MTRYAEGRLDDTLLALANPTRRAILARLAAGDACVTEIAEPFGMSLNAVSKHLKRLERAGLIHRTIAGREHRFTFDGEALGEATAWIEATRSFWEQRLAKLEDLLRARRP